MLPPIARSWVAVLKICCFIILYLLAREVLLKKGLLLEPVVLANRIYSGCSLNVSDVRTDILL